jgi:hypothetical protein
LSLGGTSCGEAPSTAAAPRAQFPPYDARAAGLFDDRIDGNAVGLADVSGNPRADPTLRARTQNAELVARVRVSTVTTDMVGGKPLYRLALAFIEPPVVRRGFGDEQVEIAVRSTSAAFGVVKWLDSGIIGRTFVGFFRRFAQGEEAEVRFHLSADTPGVVLAAREADMLNELSGK